MQFILLCRLDQLENDLGRELEDEELAHLFEHAKRAAEHSKQAIESAAKAEQEREQQLHQQAHSEHLKAHFEQHHKQHKEHKKSRSILDEIEDVRLEDLAVDYDTSIEEDREGKKSR